MKVHFILYVRDQRVSTEFYSIVLDANPTLDVPGMTEFILQDGCSLGLMPAKGIKRLLGDVLPDPERATGIPRAEVYLRVDVPEDFHRRALKAGAKELSPILERNWDDRAGYLLDPDGHVIAFAALPPSRAGYPIFSVKRITPPDRPWVNSLKDEHFNGAEFIVTRGRRVYPVDLSGFYAEALSGERVGFTSYEVRNEICEIVTLNAFKKYQGIGTGLVDAVITEGRSQKWKKIWLITTNDNLDAIRFYQKRGFVIAKTHVDSIASSRKLKPSIPLTGNFGIPIRDEIEMEVNI